MVFGEKKTNVKPSQGFSKKKLVNGPHGMISSPMRCRPHTALVLPLDSLALCTFWIMQYITPTTLALASLFCPCLFSRCHLHFLYNAVKPASGLTRKAAASGKTGKAAAGATGKAVAGSLPGRAAAGSIVTGSAAAGGPPGRAAAGGPTGRAAAGGPTGRAAARSPTGRAAA